MSLGVTGYRRVWNKLTIFLKEENCSAFQPTGYLSRSVSEGLSLTTQNLQCLYLSLFYRFAAFSFSLSVRMRAASAAAVVCAQILRARCQHAQDSFCTSAHESACSRRGRADRFAAAAAFCTERRTGAPKRAFFAGVPVDPGARTTNSHEFCSSGLHNTGARATARARAD